MVRCITISPEMVELTRIIITFVEAESFDFVLIFSSLISGVCVGEEASCNSAGFSGIVTCTPANADADDSTIALGATVVDDDDDDGNDDDDEVGDVKILSNTCANWVRSTEILSRTLTE